MEKGKELKRLKSRLSMRRLRRSRVSFCPHNHLVFFLVLPISIPAATIIITVASKADYITQALPT